MIITNTNTFFTNVDTPIKQSHVHIVSMAIMTIKKRQAPKQRMKTRYLNVTSHFGHRMALRD